jgi:hypothetical protein
VLGLTRMALALDLGGIDDATVDEQIAELAETVIPAFR